MIRFIWNTLTRFSKTVGCFLFIAGLGVASWFFSQLEPAIQSAHYRESAMLMDRLSQLNTNYADTQRLVIQFKGTGQFPPKYSQAENMPHFLPRYSEPKNFSQLREELARVSNGKEAMKQFVMNRFETLISEIQKKLLTHAADVTPTQVSLTPTPLPTPAPVSGELYAGELNKSESESRKDTLVDAKHYLDSLLAVAENPENKKTLENSLSEVDALAKLLPTFLESRPKPAPSLTFPESREPVQAEKVAKRLGEIRFSVKRAILSSWKLDTSFDQAAQLAENEERNCLNCKDRVRQLSGEMYLIMAVSITAGTVLGLFFLLIGDWTQKSSTELLAPPWCQLIENISASPKEVYETVEKCVEARRVPGLEITREFWHEGGVLSAKREYLRFARERLVFEICAAPFGTGFFLSFRSAMIPLVIDPMAIFFVLGVTGVTLIVLVNSFGLLWGAIILVLSLCVLVFLMRTALARGLADLDRVLMKTPLVGPLYEMFLRPVTYYRIDSTAMYLQAVQSAVSEAFQSMFGEKGINLLSETVSKPVMEDLYRKSL